MAFPDTIRVKLISDEAGSITITPVVVQEMSGRELVERILSHCGKDVQRISLLLKRGTLVQGASRFTWEGFEAGHEDLEAVLATFPDPEPDRAFDSEQCVLVVLHFSHGGSVEFEPHPLKKRRLLQRRSFWDELTTAVRNLPVNYAGYSYRESADRYRLDLPAPGAEQIQRAAELLTFSNLVRRIKSVPLAAIDFYTKRN